MIFKHIGVGVSGVITERLSNDTNDSVYLSIRDNQVLYVSGVSESVPTNVITDASITLAKMATTTANRLIGTDGAGVLATRTNAQFASLFTNHDGSSYKILVENTSEDGTPGFMSLSNIIDQVAGGNQGSILYRNASQWTYLNPGVSGSVLMTNGSSTNPYWIAASSIYDQYHTVHAANTVCPPIVKWLSATNNFTNTTVAPLSGLNMNVAANALYEAKYRIIASSTLGTIGPKFRVDAATTSAFYAEVLGSSGADGGTSSNIRWRMNANNTTVTFANAAGAATTVGIYDINAIFRTSASGLLSLGVAAEVSGCIISVLEPSFLRLLRLDG